MSRCAPGGGGGFPSSVIQYIDCQAEVLGTGSWRALAQPGSTLSLLLTALLTIFVALIGYNLLLGRNLTVRSGTLAMVKVGIVLALATSWPAYRTLVYDLVVDGPGQLVREIGAPARIAGADGSMLTRLDLADRALAQLAVLGPGNPPADYPQLSGQLIVPPPFAGFNAFALGGARILFLLSTIGAFAAIRLLSGLLLALGPFFIAFLLFDNSRGLFEGWLRVLAGTALASFGVAVILGLELAFLEPWLVDALTRRSAGEALPALPTEMVVLVGIFSMVLVVALVGIGRVANAFRLAPIATWIEQASGVRAERSTTVISEAATAQRAVTERSRVAGLVDSLAAPRGRGLVTATSLTLSSERSSQSATTAGLRTASQAQQSGPSSLGRSYRRQNRGRATASAARRDNRS